MTRYYTYSIGFDVDDPAGFPKKSEAERLVADQMDGDLNEETGLRCSEVKEISFYSISLDPKSLADWFDEEKETSSLLSPDWIRKIRFLREEASELDLDSIANEVLNDMTIYEAIDNAIIDAVGAFFTRKGLQ